MDLPSTVRDQLVALVLEEVPAELIENISVEDVAIDHEAGEIRIELLVSTKVKPKDFAKGYFGLSSNVRRLVAEQKEDWHSYLPILTPAMSGKAFAG
ncbi:hypothetical protein [Thalassovita sp.]|uniref:hypothetical protein n=1 Tax=Thalassovita sp. TaxID=1979401 RepID=UPI002AB083CF|nr:hypothetical protein [Thalassovita sp.]